MRQKPSRRGGLCTQQLPPSRQTLQITTSPAATRTHGPAQDEDPTPTAIPRGASFQNITPRDASPSSQEGSPPRRPCWPPDGEQSVPLVRVPRAMEWMTDSVYERLSCLPGTIQNTIRKIQNTLVAPDATRSSPPARNFSLFFSPRFPSYGVRDTFTRRRFPLQHPQDRGREIPAGPQSSPVPSRRPLSQGPPEPLPARQSSLVLLQKVSRTALGAGHSVDDVASMWTLKTRPSV
ncbi:hypothetical protein B2J93_2427 [Marssonina coronariae]|uniref:Uncharacterized protein n=1 Tax=Diplocarpon coronariae TaxID=2795749 RepID=A0A218Z1Z8_9HELO|nr:hypothetical protein B2J93_2427 [Marssonina coronariae]